MKERRAPGTAPRRSKAISSLPVSQRTSTTPANGAELELVALRYEETVAAKPPIPITSPCAPPTAAPDQHIDPDCGRRKPPRPTRDGKDTKKRDSVLAPVRSSSSRATNSSIRTVDDDVLGITINFDPTPEASSSNIAESAPQIQTRQSTRTTNATSSSFKRENTDSRKSTASKVAPRTSSSRSTNEEFAPLTTYIPTESLIDGGFLDQITFSRRGSVMLRGKKAVNGNARPNGVVRQPSISMLASPTIKVLSEDVEKESQKVRSMYEQEPTLDWRDGRVTSDANPSIEEEIIVVEEDTSANDLLTPNGGGEAQRPGSALSTSSEIREHERAGGIEDWEDVSGRDVDRYGFINIRRVSRPGTPEPRPLQRVPTVLQLASETPRKKRFGAASLAGGSSKGKLSPGRKASARSLNTQASTQSTRSIGRAQLRAAANRLPGNRDRRWMDEAGDMLTLPPGLADIAEDEEGGKAAEGLKKKEWERTEKWRKMAKVVRTGKDGEGMEFEFDTRNSKLIERTWKGIPDRWRAAAWHSFLSTSAKKRKSGAPDEQIIRDFEKLQQQSSADDVQIDIDVPRTINSHIMFRRRYRGGQRLLFRILHAISLYFPDTGYVQGMASLAATLLCYYEEEMAFVMLVRMWSLRGLDKLYETGFPGLMAALDEFQKQWLDGSDVARKLAELSIDPTAYGTRWYLTLFNYSIPFPAQLRVWDVFMLLGDPEPTISPTEERPFAGSLDILHATSAALIDGTREILLDSDFENAMKVLTSWVPVKDEELLMKVAKAEWKLHRSKKKRRS